MKNEEYLVITNVFFLVGKNILVIKGLADYYTLEKLEYPLYLNDLFITNVFLTKEIILEKKQSILMKEHLSANKI